MLDIIKGQIEMVHRVRPKQSTLQFFDVIIIQRHCFDLVFIGDFRGIDEFIMADIDISKLRIRGKIHINKLIII